jgi:hypothetical protein
MRQGLKTPGGLSGSAIVAQIQVLKNTGAKNSPVIDTVKIVLYLPSLNTLKP